MIKKQKICIIGAGATGLITALTLSKLNLDIDLVMGNTKNNFKSIRTIAISEANYNFIKKLKIFNFSEREFWPCSEMKLYSESKNSKFSKIFELKENETKQKKILYMFKNSTLIKNMIKKVKQTKSISIINDEVVSKIYSQKLLQKVKFKKKSNKYNLVIICTGNNSELVKNFFNDKPLQHSYEETSITTIVDHQKFSNNAARQIFLENGILALLPISNSKTSIVWSIKKKLYTKNENIIRNKIKFYTKDYLKNLKFKTKIEFKDLNFLIRKKYHKERALLFGDTLHSVHPLVGQGFNMTLRDLSILKKILTNRLNVGLDIGSEDILSEFSYRTKPRNFAYSMGIDLIKNSFSINNSYLINIRNNIVKNLSKNNFIKNSFFEIANKGFKF